MDVANRAVTRGTRFLTLFGFDMVIFSATKKTRDWHFQVIWLVLVWSGEGYEECAKLCRQIRTKSPSSNPQCKQSSGQFERNTL